MKATDNIKSVLTAHSLGSCIGISLYDPLVKAGGILHFMFPDSKIAPAKAQKNPFMFADTGINSFLKILYTMGAKKDNMKACIAGGAEVMGQKDFLNIGKRNYIAAKNILEENGIPVIYENVGNNFNRTIKLTMKEENVAIIIPGQEEIKICMK